MHRLSFFRRFSGSRNFRIDFRKAHLRNIISLNCFSRILIYIPPAAFIPEFKRQASRRDTFFKKNPDGCRQIKAEIFIYLRHALFCLAVQPYLNESRISHINLYKKYTISIIYHIFAYFSILCKNQVRSLNMMADFRKTDVLYFTNPSRPSPPVMNSSMYFFAISQASGSSLPRARFARIAAESVQPVPCLPLPGMRGEENL